MTEKITFGSLESGDLFKLPDGEKVYMKLDTPIHERHPDINFYYSYYAIGNDGKPAVRGKWKDLQDKKVIPVVWPWIK